MNILVKLFTGLAICISSSAVAAAATLQAKVLEVRTGNTIVVTNTNRSVQVKLKSVVPPEPGQPFSDAARDHLRALVIDQAVTVDYTHLTNGYLEARVFLNGVDVGSQMLRDGAAWYDHATDYELSGADRELYAQCEEAARAEKRGLWHDNSPLAPWEYRRILQAKIDAIVESKTVTQSKSNARTARWALSNGDFMGAFSGPSSGGSLSGLRPIVEHGTFERWTIFESPLAHFSVMVPSNALEGKTLMIGANGMPADFDIITAGSAQAFVVLVSGKGPMENGTDSAMIDKSIRELIDGVNQAATEHGHEAISVKPVRDLKLGGFAGRQYNLSGDLFSGTARVFTKQIGLERQLFMLIALTHPGSEAIGTQFLNSFKITQ